MCFQSFTALGLNNFNDWRKSENFVPSEEWTQRDENSIQLLCALYDKKLITLDAPGESTNFVDDALIPQFHSLRPGFCTFRLVGLER